ncbi:MAG: 8-oxo-dGTP diphosphatase [Clostridia bacterium]|nr:8-oxo-dGTP diphosphatase [Clostridia bacterium]
MILSSIIYIEKNEKYLMLHRTRKENDANKDKWIGVGGKFEEGETPEECARRETYEETGLTLRNLFYRGVVTFTSDEYPSEQMHLFKSTAFSGKIKDCDEGELDWIEKEKLLSLPIWEGDKIFLRLLDKDIPFFSLKLRYKGNALVQAVLNEVEILARE